MKRILMLLGLLFTDVSTLIASDDASRSILQNIATGIHQIRLPDGKSLFGDITAVMEAGCFDLDHLNDDSIAASNAFAEFKKILRNPIKTHGWLRTEYYPPRRATKIFSENYRKGYSLRRMLSAIDLALFARWGYPWSASSRSNTTTRTCSCLKKYLIGVPEGVQMQLMPLKPFVLNANA